MSLRAKRSNPAEPDGFVGAASLQRQTPSVIDSPLPKKRAAQSAFFLKDTGGLPFLVGLDQKEMKRVLGQPRVTQSECGSQEGVSECAYSGGENCEFLPAFAAGYYGKLVSQIIPGSSGDSFTTVVSRIRQEIGFQFGCQREQVVGKPERVKKWENLREKSQGLLPVAIRLSGKSAHQKEVRSDPGGGNIFQHAAGDCACDALVKSLEYAIRAGFEADEEFTAARSTGKFEGFPGMARVEPEVADPGDGPGKCFKESANVAETGGRQCFVNNEEAPVAASIEVHQISGDR